MLHCSSVDFSPSQRKTGNQSRFNEAILLLVTSVIQEWPLMNMESKCSAVSYARASLFCVDGFPLCISREDDYILYLLVFCFGFLAKYQGSFWWGWRLDVSVLQENILAACYVWFGPAEEHVGCAVYKWKCCRSIYFNRFLNMHRGMAKNTCLLQQSEEKHCNKHKCRWCEWLRAG